MALTDGGPAYPSTLTHKGTAECVGMTLRDWFAGQALVMLANYRSGKPPPEGLAARCYELADAMLAERDER